MIKVWTDAAEAGLLDRHGERGRVAIFEQCEKPRRWLQWSFNEGCLKKHSRENGFGRFTRELCWQPWTHYGVRFTRTP